MNQLLDTIELRLASDDPMLKEILRLLRLVLVTEDERTWRAGWLWAYDKVDQVDDLRARKPGMFAGVRSAVHAVGFFKAGNMKDAVEEEGRAMDAVTEWRREQDRARN